MGRVHELKSLPEHFVAVKYGKKNFEVRKDDRPYEVGDFLLLRIFNPRIKIIIDQSKLDSCMVKVVFLLRNSDFVLKDHVIMSIEKLE